MAYSHTNSKDRTYYLHSKVTKLKNDKEQIIYFFAKDVRDNALDAVPDGYRVHEAKNGLPVLKKVKEE